MKPLNPIMAALLAAFSATVASPRFAFAAETAPPVQTPPAKPAGNTDADAFAALTALIKTSDPAKSGVSARVQKYVLDDKLKFVGDDVRASADDQPKLTSVVDHWVSTAPTNAAYLFYVLSFTSPAPDWAKGDALQKIFGGGDKRDLQACLNARLTKAPQSQVGLITGSSWGKALEKFLDAAGSGAKEVLLNCDKTQRALAEKSIKDNQNGPSAPVVPGTNPANGPGGTPPDPLATNKSYGFNELYVQGAQVANIYRDPKDGYRTISIKMYSVPQKDGTVRTMLGVTDITNPGTVFSPTLVPLPLSGKTTVTVYGGKPDGSAVTRSYDLLANYDQITLSRPGTTAAGASTTFTQAGLLQARAAQASQQGTTSIGGKDYYVLGQGGATGTFLFFDKNGLGSGQPAFVSGDVNVRDNSGNWGRNQGKPNLNVVTADPSQQWHLEWASGHWTVVAGPGDVPGGGPAPAPATSTTTAPGGPPSTSTTTNAANPATTSAASPCAGVACGTYTDAYTKRDANADFSDASKQRVFLLRDNAQNATYYIKFAKNEIKGDGQMLKFSAAQVAGLVGIRGYQDSFALEIKNGNKFEVQYLPIDKVVANFNTKAPITPFDDFDTGTVKSASNLAVALDMITYYATTVKNAKGAPVAKAAAIAAITERAGKRIAGFGGKAYTVGGTVDVPLNPLLIVGGKTWEIWPGDKAYTDGGAPNPNDANLVGPGAVGDIATAADAPMPATGIDIGGGVKLTRKDKQQGADIGLYEADGTKDWYMFLRVARDGGTARTGAVKLGGPIASWMKNPSAVGLQGLADIKPPLPINAPAMQFIGDAGKGAYVVYRNVVPASDGSNVKDKPGNCAGAVIWFGVDAAAAQQACVDGHF